MPNGAWHLFVDNREGVVLKNQGIEEISIMVLIPTIRNKFLTIIAM